MLCAVTWYLARKRNYPRMPKATWAETWHAFRESVWGLMLVVIIIGGIYSGLFTATEAAAMAAVYSFFISVFVYKALKIKDVPRVLLRAANTSAMLLYIITNAVLFSFVLTQREHSLGARRLDHWRRISAGSASCCWSTCCCCWPATSWSRPRSS